MALSGSASGSSVCSGSSSQNSLLAPTKESKNLMIDPPSSLSARFEALPTNVQFGLLVLGVFFFFGIHNFLQEAIMNVEGFRSHGVMLGYTEVMGVALCSFVERTFVAKEKGRVAPLSAYPLLTCCLVGSSALSNMSLNYINFPTKVVFRSCKLIPTMVIASILHNRKFSVLEYSCALAVCFGLILFAAADWTLAPVFHPIGLVMVISSVFSDAILPNAQERLFGQGASRLEVTLYTNIFSLTAYTATTLMSGDLQATIRMTLQNRQLAIYFTVYTFIAYVAISTHMTIVKRFGGVAAVLVATGRKGMTLILSFLLFPKAFSWFYPAGAMLVLGGLLVSSLAKVRSKKSGNPSGGRHVKKTASCSSSPKSVVVINGSNDSNSSSNGFSTNSGVNKRQPDIKHHCNDVEMARS